MHKVISRFNNLDQTRRWPDVGNGRRHADRNPAFGNIRLMCYPGRMPISVFENRRKEAAPFILEPNEERYELPPLARIGVRYSFEEGELDRTFAEFGEHRISFWCDSQDRQVEIIHPTAFDLLLWDICVGAGFCGGLVNDEPTQVTDLLPATGIVTAGEFAELVIRAECDRQSPPDKHLRWIALLEAKFIQHMKSASVPAETLVQNLAQPFDAECQ